MAAPDGARTVGGAGTALVDGHVHLHDIFPVDRFLDAAATNFAREAGRLGSDASSSVLLLAESHGVRGFERIAGHRSAPFRVEATQEPHSVRIVREAEPPLIVVSGRQVVTAERLEVLALGTREVLPDGEDVATTLARVVESGALAVLPWGFGKWAGARGRRVRELVEDVPRFPHLFLGDNGGRPSRLPRPALLADGERLGRLVLPGTDPLPLAAEAGKAGRFGFVVDGALAAEHPFRSLRDFLMAQRTSPPAYGALERVGVFVRRQVALRRR